jgi:hypothetical protein
MTVVSSSADWYGAILASVMVDRINVLLRCKYVIFNRNSDITFKPIYATYNRISTYNNIAAQSLVLC